jgi:hypothetical protein
MCSWVGRGDGSIDKGERLGMLRRGRKEFDKSRRISVLRRGGKENIDKVKMVKNWWKGEKRLGCCSRRRRMLGKGNRGWKSRRGGGMCT